MRFEGFAREAISLLLVEDGTQAHDRRTFLGGDAVVLEVPIERLCEAVLGGEPLEGGEVPVGWPRDPR